MNAARQPITVHVLTGFLGAGKTTLLNRLLSLPELADTAVIINEFGAIGLDHLLVQTVRGDAVLLKNGCICCTIRGDVKDSVLSLLENMERGDIPSFTRLIIETTGLADPAPLVATFVNDPMLRHRCRPGAIVTVLDVPGGEHNLLSHPVAAQQVAAADCILLTKSDLADTGQLRHLQAIMGRLNPAASCLVQQDASRALLDALLVSDSSAAHGWTILRSMPDDAGLHNGIGSTLLTCDQPIEWSSFAVWLSMLLHRHGGRVLRLKGLLNVRDMSAPVAVQAVQHIVHRPVHLDAWPDGDRRTRIVVIGHQVNSRLLRKSFDLLACGVP